MKTKIQITQVLWVFAALLATAASSLNAQQPIPPAILQSAAPNEPFFIEIDSTARRAESFQADWSRLRGNFASRQIIVQEQWVGPSRLYLRVQLPPATIAGRNELIAQLLQQPGISRVISGATAHAELKDIHEVEKFDGRAAIPDTKLRGFRQKRVGFNPDTRAPHTGEILLKYLESESHTPAKAEATRARLAPLHAAWGGRVRRTMEIPDGTIIEVVELPKVINFGSALQAYNSSPLVEYAEPNYILMAHAVPNDPFYSSLWAMPKISAPAAWDVRTNANTVIVAVTDTGIDYNHPDLAGNMWINPDPISGYDGLYGRNSFDAGNRGNPMDDNAPNYHGTHVAGTIGAVGNNGIGVAGVAWNVKLMAVKVLNSRAGGTPEWVVDGIDYAIQKGAHIINASWGGTTHFQIIQDAIVRAKNAGVLFVNSAGNLNNDNDAVPTYPASYNLSNMVVVGASDESDQRSIWPQFGPGVSSHWGRWSVDVFAPGSNIYSTMQGNRYQLSSGTSMAAPHVAGMLALAKAQFPWESARELVDRGRFSINAVGSLDSLSLSGGRSNAAKSLGVRPRLLNLSTRCQVNTGGEIGIAGIIITGSAPKQVAFRSQGPNLASYGVPGVLGNPQITIYNGYGQVIGYNDDWVTLSTADKNALASAGATPVDSLESAWVGTLSPGAYTMHLSGVGGGTGIGIIESFDADGSTQNRLQNVSTRCYVGTGAEVAIAGTIVVGDKPRNVYIRTLGPTLGSSYGVPGALQDTVITLYDGSGNPIASSDDWGGGGTAFGNRLVQNGNPPEDYRESAIIARLNSGAYTVIVEGKNGTTGVGLIEINEF